MRINRSYNIPDMLKPFIRDLWVLHTGNSKNADMVFSAYADGCPGLIFHQSEGGLRFNDQKKNLSPLFLYGQTIQPALLKAQGCQTMIILIFHPHAIPPVFRLSAHELTDGCLEMNQLSPLQNGILTEQLLHAPGIETQLKILFGYLKELIQRHQSVPNQEMRYATTQILQSGSENSLRAIQKSLHFTERTFERKFARFVGISPRLLLRISKFQAAVAQIKLGNFSKLSDVAYANGYADQSHFNRDFREFTGLTPTAFLLQTSSQEAGFQLMAG